MPTWRGTLCHTTIALLIPAYYTIRCNFTIKCSNLPSPLLLTISGFIWLWIIRRITVPFFTSPLHKLPSPAEGWFPTGHVKYLLEEPPLNRIPKVCRETPNDGLVLLWGFLYLEAVVIPTSPTTIMEVLNNHSYDWEKPVVAKKLLARTLGQGLINVEGNAHKAMRRAVAPAFSGRQIRDLVPLFYRKGLAFGDSLAREAKTSKDGALEMMHQMSRVTLDIIGAAGVGKDFNTIENDEDQLARYYATITDTNRRPVVLYFLINVMLPPWLVRRLPGKVYAKVAQAQLDLRTSIRELVAWKRRAMEMKTVEQKDIIATIMRSGDFTDDYLVDQLLTFLAAGHDTTASALTWTTYLLSKNPSMQDRLRKECHDHLSGISADQVDAGIIDQMPYLTAVCNETLRLYPTVPATARHAVVDTKISSKAVPKGTRALISPWMLNRLPMLWGSDADEYNPDRWLEGALANTGGTESPHALITFLHGPRSCIGQNFARTEMKCLLATLIMRFKFEVVDPTVVPRPVGFVTIKPKDGLRLKLHDLQA